MLQVFGFERIGVVIGDIYFIDPRPSPGEEGPEQGVRLEVRFLDRGELKGSIYSAQPIAVDRPIWRIDLLESVDSPNTFDRTHHHPRFHGWNPTKRHFVPELTADPLGWLEARLTDLQSVLDEAKLEPGEVDADDVAAVKEAAPDIVAAVARMLDGVRAGRLGQPPAEGAEDMARAGWL
jgi:hypothetical protein